MEMKFGIHEATNDIFSLFATPNLLYLWYYTFVKFENNWADHISIK